MAKRIWNVELGGEKHTVEIDHRYLDGRRILKVDGVKREIPKSELPGSVDYGSEHSFSVAGHDLCIKIKTDGVRFSYGLYIDGLPVGDEPAPLDPMAMRKAENRVRRIVSAPILVFLGLLALWFNRSLAGGRDFFSESLALITPLPFVMALYFLLFPGDMSKFSRGAVIRVIVAVGISFALGYWNVYALSHGLY